MKTIRFLLPCFVVLFFLSCKKSKTDPPVTPPTIAKIKTMTFGTYIVTYEYDIEGRLSKLLENNGNRIEYDYTNSSRIEVRTYDVAGVLTNHARYDLNSLGLVESVVNVIPAVGTTNLLQYNSNKELIRQVQGNSSTLQKYDTRLYYGSDGRMDSLIQENTNEAGVVITRYKKSYTYSITKPNTISNENQGSLFWGVSIPHPYDREVYTDLFGTQPQGETNLTYEYDSQNRIIKQIRVYPPPDAADVYTYTYY